MLALLLLTALGAQPAPSQIRAAVLRALPLIEASSAAYVRERGCFSCHHQAVPVLALAAARAHGFRIDERNFRAQVEFTRDSLARAREAYAKGQGQGGEVTAAGYALWTLAAGGALPDATSAAVAHYLVVKAPALDHWQPASHRPPMEASDFTTTFLAVRALHDGTDEADRAAAATRVEQARAWLTGTRPADTEDRVFRLRALRIAGGDTKKAAAELLGTQRSDGGWGQTDEGESDAYATASALAALAQAGDLNPTDPAYTRGVGYLLRQQRRDGSWHVRTRSHPVQPYFESGFPHGKDQFVSMAASAWAVLALSLACPAQAAR